MACKILTEERWKRLLENSLNRDEKTMIFDHLDCDCPDCEYLLEHMTEDEEMYFLAIVNKKAAEKNILNNASHMDDRLIIAPGSSGTAILSQDNVTTTQMSERIRSAANNVVSGLFGGRNKMPLWAGSVAAMLLVAIVIAPQYQRSLDQPVVEPIKQQPLQFEKGIGGNVVDLGLQFATGRFAADGKFTLERGMLGEHVGDTDLLFLHYNLPVNGYVYILGYQPESGISLIYPESLEKAASHTPGGYNLPGGDQLSGDGISLAGISGRYLVVGVYSESQLESLDSIMPLMQQVVDQKTGSIDAAKLNAAEQGLSLDVLYFDVTS